MAAIVRMNLWLETDDGVAFGLGRLLLLEALRDLGSLKAAAEKLGMSYRAAWGKLKTTEEALGRPLVEKPAGNRSGYQLTMYGAELADRFREWFDAIEAEALHKARELFPFHLRGFHDRKRQRVE